MGRGERREEAWSAEVAGQRKKADSPWAAAAAAEGGRGGLLAVPSLSVSYLVEREGPLGVLAHAPGMMMDQQASQHHITHTKPCTSSHQHTGVATLLVSSPAPPSLLTFRAGSSRRAR